jgi:hypothetical protein
VIRAVATHMALAPGCGITGARSTGKTLPATSACEKL